MASESIVAARSKAPRSKALLQRDGSLPVTPEVMQIADGYLAELESGRRPDPEKLIADHPDVAGPLRAFLASLDFLAGAAESLRGHDGDFDVGENPAPAFRQFGEFRLIRQIGRGGMGVVYEAEQISLARRVALKILPFAGVLDPRQLQRFRNESRAAASLHHPHIVPVYAVGSERGVHYYAMQLIEGQTLEEIIRDLADREGPGKPAADASAHGGPAASTAPKAAFSTSGAFGSREYYRAVARLGVQVAEALEHAHGVGVTHRDIKPSNLIVDGQGDVWVTDFGLAQVETDVSLTQSGDVLGTLRYMSPEQAAGERGVLDHHTDIYSLGVTLYELISLSPAFSGQDRQSVLRKVTAEAPPPLHRLRRSVPHDLETIVLKAIEKSPGDRYTSAQSMAEDLRSFLANQPIRARRAKLRTRVMRWSQRHSTLVLSAIAALLVCTAVLAISSLRTSAALGVAKQRTEDANWHRERAEKNLDRAQAAVDRMLDHVAENRLFNAPHMSGTRREMLEEALEFRKMLAEDLPNDPDFARDTAMAHLKLGDIELALANIPRAIDEYTQGRALLDLAMVQGEASEEDRAEFAHAHFRLGRALFYDDQLAEAQREYSLSLAILDPLCAASRTPEKHLLLAATVRRHLAQVSEEAECSQVVEDGLRVMERLVRRDPTNAEHQQELGNVTVHGDSAIHDAECRAEAQRERSSS